jgi:hypothetical protein
MVEGLQEQKKVVVDKERKNVRGEKPLIKSVESLGVPSVLMRKGERRRLEVKSEGRWKGKKEKRRERWKILS